MPLRKSGQSTEPLAAPQLHENWDRNAIESSASENPSQVADITGNYAPFDTCASQRTTAHLLDQISHVEELGVKNPYPQQPESDGCIQNALA